MTVIGSETSATVFQQCVTIRRCTVKIDRGLAYVCGGEAYGGEEGCGLFFCKAHLYFGRSEDAPQLCPKCFRYDHKPYKPKSNVPEWTEFKMTDPSWAEWRKANAPEITNDSTTNKRTESVEANGVTLCSRGRSTICHPRSSSII